MAFRASEQEIQRQLQEGRNYKRLYRQLKSRFDALAAEHKECPKRIAALQAKLDTQAIQIAELQNLVFGKRRRPPTGRTVPALPLPVALPRDAASYRRVVPNPEAVTATEHCLVAACRHCGSKLSDLTEHVRYVEDIPLPELTPDYHPHLVTKYVITRGVCTACGRTTAGRELGGAEVSLGSNVRLLVVDLIARMGLSYSQVSQLLLGLYGLAVTDGEIVSIMQSTHLAWLPAYNQLKADIRAAPIDQVDETPWPIQELQGSGYAWDLADATSEAVCFALEDSRGARHAQELLGQNTDQPFAGVRISDDYGPYRNAQLPGSQQLCWAHLYRNIRDVRYNDNLPAAQLPYVAEWYSGFAAIYDQLRQYLATPYDKPRRQAAASSLWSQLRQLIRTKPTAAGEPAKLTRLKAQLIRAGKDRLFVCLPADTPCDNNRAERDLRQLVLKRKRSFGGKTQKGAKALATVLSLCTTTWRRSTKNKSNPTGYFASLAAIAG